MARDWLIGTGLADWHRIGQLAPVGRLATDWPIGTRLAPDWPIGTGLADWHRIGRLAPDWHGLARIGKDWQIGEFVSKRKIGP